MSFLLCVNPECPFGDVSICEPRAFSGSLHALRPLAEGTLTINKERT
jgi:hypothetical protein